MNESTVDLVLRKFISYATEILNLKNTSKTDVEYELELLLSASLEILNIESLTNDMLPLLLKHLYTAQGIAAHLREIVAVDSLDFLSIMGGNIYE